jgi:hypothetical protein
VAACDRSSIAKELLLDTLHLISKNPYLHPKKPQNGKEILLFV